MVAVTFLLCLLLPSVIVGPHATFRMNAFDTLFLFRFRQRIVGGGTWNVCVCFNAHKTVLFFLLEAYLPMYDPQVLFCDLRRWRGLPPEHASTCAANPHSSPKSG